ncbi:MAG: Hsp20/alpha crystallin family protein [Pseudomonadota bacterium]
MSKPTINKVTSQDDRKLPVFEEFDQIAKAIKARAYDLFARRGYKEGHDMEDWLTAQREYCWPAAELVELDKEYDIKVALAGFEPDDITVTATPTELLVKACHKDEDAGNDDGNGQRVRWTEFHSNEVYRQIPLPGSTDVDKVQANFSHGMLEVKLPKAGGKPDSKKKVKISSAA